MIEILNKNLIAIAIIIAGLIIGGVYFYTNQEAIQGLSAQEAADKAISFINQSIEKENVTASLLDVTEETGLYKIHLKIEETEYNSYITKDGKLLFPNAFNLEEQTEEVAKEEDSAPEEIIKKDTPEVKLFVMSYCPYGLQAQKMFLPVYNLLKDKVEMEVYFVDYIMHEKKEIDENLRQYCIQKEEAEKYYSYLSCFVVDGNFEKCFSDTKIDKTKLESCVSETDKEFNITSKYNDKSTWIGSTCPDPPYCFPKFDVQSDLNKKYGVEGSPVVVINDEIVNVNPRSPEKFKEIICSAFNSEPSECSQTLSDEAFSSGFGLISGSSSSGSCE